MRAAGFRFPSGAFYFHSFQAWDWMGWKWQIPFQTLGVELIQRWSLTIFVQVRQHPLDQSLVCIGFGKLAGLTAVFLTILWTYRQMNVQKRHKNEVLGLSVQMRKKYVIPPVTKKKKKNPPGDEKHNFWWQNPLNKETEYYLKKKCASWHVSYRSIDDGHDISLQIPC